MLYTGMGQYQLMSAQLSVSVTTIARNNLENPAIFKDQQQVAEALAVARRQTEIHHTTHRFQLKKKSIFYFNNLQTGLYVSV
jgi:hypothetical protein